MKKILSLLVAMIMCLGMMSTVFAAEMTFTDVHEGDWYYEDVKYAVENGLINGKSYLIFAPNSPLTNAEAVKLAACLNQLYMDGSVTLSSGLPWYMPYVDFCLEKGIIEKDYEWSRTITRSEFVIIFANTLPEEAYTQINEIEYGEIPDVQEGSEYYEAAYKLYRAGILTGSGENHILRPESMISRAEVAAIVTRMVDESRRVEFAFEKREDETPKEENTEDNTEGNTFVNVDVVITPDNTDNTQGNINITDGSRNDNVNSSEDDDVIYGEVKTDNDEKTEVVVVTPIVDNEDVNGQTSTNQGNTNINILALSIKTQPVSVKVTEIPARVTFTVEVTGGTAPYTYQWESQEKIGASWVKMPEPVAKRGTTSTANYTGSTTNTLKLAVTKDNLGILNHKFRCVITDANGNTVTSNIVNGTINLSSTRSSR